MILFTTQDGSFIFTNDELVPNLKAVEVENIYELIELHAMFDPLSLMGCYRFKVLKDNNEILPILARNFIDSDHREFHVNLLDGLTTAQIIHQTLDAYPYSVARGWVNSLRVAIPHTITSKETYELVVMRFNDDSVLTIRINDIEKSVKAVAS